MEDRVNVFPFLDCLSDGFIYLKINHMDSIGLSVSPDMFRRLSESFSKLGSSCVTTTENEISLTYRGIMFKIKENVSIGNQ